ncbi:MAG: DNA polymerase III subunit alpha [Bacteroidales bacterium]
MLDFTHLHVHTRYSILDGASHIPLLMDKAKEMGMNAMAITDHGNMFGVMEFVTEANKRDIKPIVGCEVYVAENSRFNKNGKEDRSGFHLILLAKNEAGYHNLNKLCSLGFKKEAFYYTPRIDHELLEKYHDNIIACSACLAGEIPQYILNGQEKQLHESIAFFKRLFGKDYYFEMQNHGHVEQQIVNERILELAAQYHVKCIATNDVHFVNAQDKDAHKILICLNTGRKLSEQTKLIYTGEEYLKSAQEMIARFPGHEEFLTNTREIVDKVEVYKLTRDILLPKFPLPENFSNEMDYLRFLTYQGAEKRYGKNYANHIKERIDFELQTIEHMGFPGYFLIVWDFIKKAREMKVLVGPGRGSAAGSAIAYCIGITNMDPIKYNLLFERFLNPARISMPDIDIDFDDAGREKVIHYVVEKYGRERVAQIITYGSMAAKSAIKDVARVLELPLSEASRLADLVPETPGMTLAKAFKESPQLKEEMENSPNELIRRTIKYAVQLEGSIRSTGTHACGMIIAPEDIMEYVPLSTSKDTDMPVTQYEGQYVESVGLLKMDFLGLKTLTIIKGALDNIKIRHGLDVDMDEVPLEDKLTYDLFSRGDTNAIFQFESDGMKKYLRELKPNRLDDLIAMNALYRPGPMEYIPKFVHRKFGIEKIEYDLPEMEEFLADTYGVTVYQEQVMLLSQKLADFTKGDADTLRKAMGKKKKDILEKMKAKFMDGCAAHNHDPKICDKIWTDWEAFASYAFNKSHSTCYAFIAYQTAYLKAHYPAEFMASVLTNNLTNIEKISFYMDECKRMKIDLLGPDVNESQAAFTVNKAGAIRFGLSGIKNVGAAVVELLIKEREENGYYRSVLDFVKRSNLRSLNRRCMESLVKAGAFDAFGEPTRAAFFYERPGENVNFIDNLMLYASRYQQTQLSAQTNLFGEAESEEMSDLEIPQVDPWVPLIELNYEKEVTGFFISGHPLQDYRFELSQFATTTITHIKGNLSSNVNKDLRFGAIVTASSHLISKKGTGYGRFMVEDFDESLEITLFGEDYLKYKHFMEVGTFVFIRAEVKKRWRDDENLELKIVNMFPLAELADRYTHQINIKINLMEINPNYIAKMKELVHTYGIKMHASTKGESNAATLNFRVVDSVHTLSLNMPMRGLKVKSSEFIKAFLEEYPDMELNLS